MNYHRAEAAPGPLLFLPPPPGNHERLTLVPQAMILWRGLDVVCYNRRYSKSSPIAGCVYIVTDLDDKTVTIQLHSDYLRKEWKKPEKPKEPKTDDDSEDSGSELDVEAATKTPDKKQNGTSSYKLSHKRAAELLRLRYAMVYASIQGITLTERHACLMDSFHPGLTMRDLITAMSRPTHGSYLHFMEPDQEDQFFRYGENITDEMLEQLVVRRNREL
jgi:hypothetical protein